MDNPSKIQCFCSKWFTPKKGYSTRTKHCSRRCRVKYFKETLHPHWYISHLKSGYTKEWMRLNKIEYDKFKIKTGCQRCGYKKCASALHFHHIYKRKFFISPLIWKSKGKKMVKELNKCILLCANCHTEFHAQHKSFRRWYYGK